MYRVPFINMLRVILYLSIISHEALLFPPTFSPTFEKGKFCWPEMVEASLFLLPLRFHSIVAAKQKEYLD